MTGSPAALQQKSEEMSPKRNKRKSQEPKRVATDVVGLVRPAKRVATDNRPPRALNFETSDGEERHGSPRGGSSSPDSCRSNPSLAPPKKRY